MTVEQPLVLSPGLLTTDSALRTLSEALSQAGTTILDIDAGEIRAEFRPALTDLGRSGMEAEIYLYDTLPGGAGFAGFVGDLGIDLFEKALSVLEKCPDNCDQSCYRCLRSYKNKFEHELLDRHLGASLLKYLLTGAQPTIDSTRLDKSTKVLFNDLERNIDNDVVLKRNAKITAGGLSETVAPIYVTREGGDAPLVIALHHPLTPNEPPNEELRDYMEYQVEIEVRLIDELHVLKNLPRVTNSLIEDLTESS